MKKLLKISLIIIVLSAALLVAVRFLLDPVVDKYARAFIKENIGVKVEFKSVHVGLFPISAEVNGIEIFNRDKPEITVKRVSVYPSLLPLLKKQIAVRRIAVTGPEITVYPVKKGTNLDEIIAQFDDRDKPKSDSVSLDMSLDKITIADGVVRYYLDQAMKDYVELNPLDATIADLILTDKTKVSPFSAQVGLFGGKQRIRAQGTVVVFADKPSAKGEIKIKDLALTDLGRLLDKTVKINRGTASLNGDFDFMDGNLNLGDIVIAAAGLDAVLVASEGTVQSATVPPAVPDNVEIKSLSVLINDAAITVDESKTAAVLTINKVTADIGKLAYQVSGSPLTMRVELANPAAAVEITGTIRVSSGTPAATIALKADCADLNTVNPFIAGVSPARIIGGKLAMTAAGNVSWANLNLPCHTVFSGLKLESADDGVVKKVMFGVPVPLLISYLSENDGNLDLEFKVYGSVPAPQVDISKALRKLIGRVAIDAALMNTVGLPAVLGDKVLEKTTGTSGIDSIKGLFKKK